MRLPAKSTTRALLSPSSLSSRAPQSPHPSPLFLLPSAATSRPPLQLAQSFFTPGHLAASERNTLSDVVEISRRGALLWPGEAGGLGGGGPPDERTIRLGKTLRILQSRLPTVLAKPLPTEILSPHISLHLFPSTHPHLPNVSGRVAYHAALWTSPITWGRVPLIGNVKLEIVSERMVRNGPSYHSQLSQNSGSGHGSSSIGGGKGGQDASVKKSTPLAESLIVRWKTCGGGGGKENGNNSGGNAVLGKMAEWLGRDASGGDSANGNGNGNGCFEGLFIFEFDEDGRILSHTIERAEQGGDRDAAGVGKWIALTDWLLGRLGGRGEPQPGLALGYVRDRPGRLRRLVGS